jgi:type IV pilus assembly protein PilA
MDMIKKRAAMRGQGGFTLVELLVAVAILAILAGVAVFAVGSLTSDSAVSACKTEADTIRVAINAARSATPTAPAVVAPVADPKKMAATYLQGTPKYFATTNIPAASATNAASQVGSGTVTVARLTTGPNGAGSGGPTSAECGDVTA